MSCLGVTGKPMVVTVKCGVESDCTWIVLELIGALEQPFPRQMH